MSYDSSYPRTASDLWQNSGKKGDFMQSHPSGCLDGVFSTPIRISSCSQKPVPGQPAAASACLPHPKQQRHLVSQCSLLAFGASPFIPGRPGSPFGPEAPGIPGHPWRTASRSASLSPTILTSKEMKTVFMEIIRALKCLREKTKPSGVEEQCKQKQWGWEFGGVVWINRWHWGSCILQELDTESLCL